MFLIVLIEIVSHFLIFVYDYISYKLVLVWCLVRTWFQNLWFLLDRVSEFYRLSYQRPAILFYSVSLPGRCVKVLQAFLPKAGDPVLPCVTVSRSMSVLEPVVPLNSESKLDAKA